MDTPPASKPSPILTMVEPAEENKASISVSEICNVVSIAQALVYLASKGKMFTHKSLALAMATRHVTGSVKLVKILHGLGHCVASATAYKHDSALALSCNSSNQDVIIPRNIIPGSFLTIVWDKNEETVSGKETTHVANGMIVQKKSLRKMKLSNQYLLSNAQRQIFFLTQSSTKDCLLYSLTKMN